VAEAEIKGNGSENETLVVGVSSDLFGLDLSKAGGNNN
jgi:hypothetical protein